MQKSLFLLPSLFLLACVLPAQPLPSRVLVIHNTQASAATQSLDVASDYVAQRSIPAPNLCGISFPHEEEITLTQWNGSIRPAIQACLNAVGRTNILYVVLSYRTPFRITNGIRVGALDSYVADIWNAYSSTDLPGFYAGNHRYFADAQSLGNVYPAFLTFASYRAQPRSLLFYSVWRLDGPSLAIAKGLVTKAKAAEAAGGVDAAPGGITYVDRIYSQALFPTLGDYGYPSGDHDLERMAQMAASAGLTVVKDTNSEEIGFSPAPLTAPNAILYAGWYTLATYNNVFTWRTGAVGWHMDSSAGAHPRQGPTWVANSLINGITVTSGAVAEPDLTGIAHPDVVSRHLLQGGNVGDAFLRGTPGLKWMILNVGDPLYVPFPGGRPFNSPGYTKDTLSVTTRAMVSGTAQATLTLENPAPSGGVTVNWLNNWTPNHVTALPASTTIPAGQRSTTVGFTVVNPVPTDEVQVLITATYNSQEMRNSVSVRSLLSQFAAPGSIAAGGSFNGVLVLNAIVGTPTVATLTSSHPSILQVPASVTVPTGALVALAPVTTTAGSVAAPTVVTITATSGPYVVTRQVTVTP